MHFSVLFYYCNDEGCRLLFILISEKTSNSQSFIHIQQTEDSPQEGASWVGIRLVLHTLTHITKTGQSIVAAYMLVRSAGVDIVVPAAFTRYSFYLFFWLVCLFGFDFCVHHSNFYWTFITQINTK